MYTLLGRNIACAIIEAAEVCRRLLRSTTALKTQNCRDDNLIVTGGTGGCPHDNPRRRPWPQSYYDHNPPFSMSLCYLMVTGKHTDGSSKGSWVNGHQAISDHRYAHDDVMIKKRFPHCITRGRSCVCVCSMDSCHKGVTYAEFWFFANCLIKLFYLGWLNIHVTSLYCGPVAADCLM